MLSLWVVINPEGAVGKEIPVEGTTFMVACTFLGEKVVKKDSL